MDVRSKADSALVLEVTSDESVLIERAIAIVFCTNGTVTALDSKNGVSVGLLFTLKEFVLLFVGCCNKISCVACSGVISDLEEADVFSIRLSIEWDVVSDVVFAVCVSFRL